MNKFEEKMFENELKGIIFSYSEKDNVEITKKSMKTNYKELAIQLKLLKILKENEKLSFLDKVIYILSKMGFKISKLDSKLYNECYKMIEYIKSIEMNNDINSDLLYGLEETGAGRDYKKLDILLKQHIIACDYREYKDMFYENYKKNEGSNISYEERIAIYSFTRQYKQEKELVKKYK